jgi:hypothetical protein
MDEDPNSRGEAGGVAGEKRVAKRSSRSGLVRGGDRLPAGTGMRGVMEWSGEGIKLRWVNNVSIGTEAEGN